MATLIDAADAQGDPPTWIALAHDGFFADKFATENRHPIAMLCKDPHRFAASRVRPKSERRAKVREWTATDSQPDSPPVPVADAAKSLLEGLGIREPRTGAT